LIELKRSLYKLDENDPELKPWDDRLTELAGDLDDIDSLLMELDAGSGADTAPAPDTARGQLELFGSLLTSLAEQKQTPEHQVIVSDGTQFGGTWEEIVRHLRDERGNPSHSVEEFMRGVSQHGFRETGVRIPTHDAESFIRGSAVAGLLRIVR
jgi:hypothetical protein